MFAGLPYQSPQLNMLKRFQNDRAFNARNGTETLLCNVTVVLNIAAFLRYCVIPGEGFRIKNKAYFTWEMTEEFARWRQNKILSKTVACVDVRGWMQALV